MGNDGSFYAIGERSRFDEVTYYYMGSDREFPRESELPLDALRDAVKEFPATNGEQPASVTWASA